MMQLEHNTQEKYQSFPYNPLSNAGQKQSAVFKNQQLHPTQNMQNNLLEAGERQELAKISVNYGSHMAMRHVIEANIFATTSRDRPKQQTCVNIFF